MMEKENTAKSHCIVKHLDRTPAVVLSSFMSLLYF